MDEGSDQLEEGEIDEPCDTTPVTNHFLVSRASREPQTICSEESSENSENSDDDSDNQFSKPKKLKSQPPLPAVNSKQVPNKYKVWSLAVQEEALTENLIKCGVKPGDRERDVESYNYKQIDKTDYSQYSNYHMPVSECHYLESDYIRCSSDDDKHWVVGSKRRHTKRRRHLKRGIGVVRELPHLAVTADNSYEEVAEDIASKLRETKINIILNVVVVLGKEKAIALYNETKDVEDNGGMLLMNGERRRTAGGVYFLLMKRDNSIASEAMKKIFEEEREEFKRNRSKARRRRKKEKTEELKEMLIREKLLSLNTTASRQNQDSESKNSDIPLETEINNPEEEDGELTVTNPPPSPATDQDTPPSRTLGGSEDEAVVKHAESLGRKVVCYADDDDDYLQVDTDDMDFF